MNNVKKRRKSKYNPYTLIYNEEKKYQVSFIDGQNKKQIVNISYDLFTMFNNFELEDLKEMNEFDRHIEHLEQTENSIYKKSFKKDKNVEEIVISNIMVEHLMNEISNLPLIQKRRLKKYFFDNMTLKQIANEEKCSIRAVKYSIDIALTTLKKFLKKFYY